MGSKRKDAEKAAEENEYGKASTGCSHGTYFRETFVQEYASKYGSRKVYRIWRSESGGYRIGQ